MVAPSHQEARIGTGTRTEEVCWDEVVRCVHRQMRSLVGPCSELEDLAQVALEQVLRTLDRFEGRSELTTYTYGICANVALHHFRSWRRFFRRFEIGRDDVSDATPASLADASDHLIAEERQRRLHRALDRLAPTKRVTLVLMDLEELPASTVGEILGVPEPTVRSRLRTARAELHSILKRDPLFAAEGSRAT